MAWVQETGDEAVEVEAVADGHDLAGDGRGAAASPGSLSLAHTVSISPTLGVRQRWLAVASPLPERNEGLGQTVWPPSPVAGRRLHRSPLSLQKFCSLF